MMVLKNSLQNCKNFNLHNDWSILCIHIVHNNGLLKINANTSRK